MCDYCKEDGDNIFEIKYLDDLPFKLGSSFIHDQEAMYNEDVVFIDRGYLRLAPIDDADCMDHGEKVKIKYCPFCGNTLDI